MNRDILLYRLCPMHRIYDCCNSDTNFHCVDCTRVMNEWLDGYDNQIRADAIDEFAKKLIQTVTSMTTEFRIVGNIERIAKELKEQKKYE